MYSGLGTVPRYCIPIHSSVVLQGQIVRCAGTRGRTRVRTLVRVQWTEFVCTVCRKGASSTRSFEQCRRNLRLDCDCRSVAAAGVVAFFWEWCEPCIPSFAVSNFQKKVTKQAVPFSQLCTGAGDTIKEQSTRTTPTITTTTTTTTTKQHQHTLNTLHFHCVVNATGDK